MSHTLDKLKEGDILLLKNERDHPWEMDYCSKVQRP